MQKAIVINADDFGLSDGVCQSIIELLEAGAVSSTTLMTAAFDARDRMSKWNVKSLLGRAGVHLQLTGGRALSARSQVKTLVSANGDFIDPRDNSASPDPAEVEIEWRNQIEAASELLGGPPTHLDSHHGMHRRPDLIELYFALARELAVPVRGAPGDIGTMMRSRSIRGSVAIVRDWTGSSFGMADLKAKIDICARSNPIERAIEVIVHPGHCDTYLKSVSSLSDRREVEHAALMQMAKERWPVKSGYVLRPFSVF